MSSELPARGPSIALITDPSFTVDGFCRAEVISRSQLYDFWREGKGPRFYWNGAHRRITAEARRDWQKEREREAAAALAGNEVG
jgi:hypothetical protein